MPITPQTAMSDMLLILLLFFTSNTIAPTARGTAAEDPPPTIQVAASAPPQVLHGSNTPGDGLRRLTLDLGPSPGLRLEGRGLSIEAVVAVARERSAATVRIRVAGATPYRHLIDAARALHEQGLPIELE